MAIGILVFVEYSLCIQVFTMPSFTSALICFIDIHSS
uniref:Uncharacterized protein n=1 Tax=Rhizophora mucronata TaxID=61149 RepID=A0A2P2JLT5_RHIMU